MTNHKYLVSKLRQGTVIDHLRAGTALRALRVLRLPPGRTVSVGIYLESGRLERKDIIKIEDYELNEEEAAKVALISPHATLSIIRDFEVTDKIDLHPPLRFKGILRCPNQACITNAENLRGSWLVIGRSPITVRCEYCERSVSQEHLGFS